MHWWWLVLLLLLLPAMARVRTVLVPATRTTSGAAHTQPTALAFSDVAVRVASPAYPSTLAPSIRRLRLVSVLCLTRCVWSRGAVGRALLRGRAALLRRPGRRVVIVPGTLLSGVSERMERDVRVGMCTLRRRRARSAQKRAARLAQGAVEAVVDGEEPLGREACGQVACRAEHVFTRRASDQQTGTS